MAKNIIYLSTKLQIAIAILKLPQFTFLLSLSNFCGVEITYLLTYSSVPIPYTYLLNGRNFQVIQNRLKTILKHLPT